MAAITTINTFNSIRRSELVLNNSDFKVTFLCFHELELDKKSLSAKSIGNSTLISISNQCKVTHKTLKNEFTAAVCSV